MGERAPLWVSGHAWGFQTDTLWKMHQPKWVSSVPRSGPSLGSFWRFVESLWGQVWLGLDAHISFLCCNSLISPLTLSEQNSWFFTSSFLIPMQMASQENKQKSLRHVVLHLKCRNSNSWKIVMVLLMVFSCFFASPQSTGATALWYVLCWF